MKKYRVIEINGFFLIEVESPIGWSPSSIFGWAISLGDFAPQLVYYKLEDALKAIENFPIEIQKPIYHYPKK